MNKQQLFSALVGTALTLGGIGVTSAGNPTWRYDAESDTVTYAFSGPDHHSGGEADNPVNQQYGNQPRGYDTDTGAGIRTFTGPGHRIDGEAGNPVNRQSGIWPWNDPFLTDSWD
jgi:hypothetical protein